MVGRGAVLGAPGDAAGGAERGLAVESTGGDAGVAGSSGSSTLVAAAAGESGDSFVPAEGVLIAGAAVVSGAVVSVAISDGAGTP